MSPLLLGGLVSYIAFLVFYAVWALFMGYHLVRFAPRRETVLMSIGVFVVVTVALLLLSVAALLRLDWSAPLTITGAGL